MPIIINTFEQLVKKKAHSKLLFYIEIDFKTKIEYFD